MRRALHALAFCLLAAGTGCMKQPPVHYYLLEAVAPSPETRSRAGISVGIRDLAVDAPYDASGIVYRIGRSPEVGFYAYHEWASPLSSMVPRLIADALAGTPGIAAIEPAVPGDEYDALLQGRLLALEEVDFQGGQHVRLRMTLYLERGGMEIWRQTVTTESSTQTDRVEAIVQLMNETLLDAVRDLGPGLAKALRDAG